MSEAFHMFLSGEIVFAPCPSGSGRENISPHYLVVLGETPEGVVCMFTTSVKEPTGGGKYAFTEAERAAAGFSKPCRFDPSRLVLYSPTVAARVLRRCSGRLNRQQIQRLLQAAMAVKARYVTYRHAA